MYTPKIKFTHFKMYYSHLKRKKYGHYTQMDWHSFWQPTGQVEKWQVPTHKSFRQPTGQIEKVVFQAWNFIFERARPFYVLQRAHPLENLKLNGKLLQGHQGQDQGQHKPWPAHYYRLGVFQPTTICGRKTGQNQKWCWTS